MRGVSTQNTSKHLNETCGRSNQGLADATTEQWEEVGDISMKRGQGRVTPLVCRQQRRLWLRRHLDESTRLWFDQVTALTNVVIERVKRTAAWETSSNTAARNRTRIAGIHKRLSRFKGHTLNTGNRGS